MNKNKIEKPKLYWVDDNAQKPPYYLADRFDITVYKKAWCVDDFLKDEKSFSDNAYYILDCWMPPRSLGEARKYWEPLHVEPLFTGLALGRWLLKKKKAVAKNIIFMSNFTGTSAEGGELSRGFSALFPIVSDNSIEEDFSSRPPQPVNKGELRKKVEEYWPEKDVKV